MQHKNRFAPTLAVILFTLCALAESLTHLRAQEAGDAPDAPADAPDAAAGARADADAPGGRLDPAAWGSDHAGGELPEFFTGDECLFCHRIDIGTTWPDNHHGQTLRFKDKEPELIEELARDPRVKKTTDETVWVMGRDRKVNLLRAGEGYGQIEIATAVFYPPQYGNMATLIHGPDSKWLPDKYGQKCAGCHSSGVTHDPITVGFATLDCYSCHGDVSLDHTNDSEVMLLSFKRGDEPRVVASICGQCHLRGGKSRTTGLPYPSNFIPGDNLFRDFEVNFSEAYLQTLDLGDRHIYENIRDIVIHGREEVTCLSCHEIHKNSSKIHVGVAEYGLCNICHSVTGPKNRVKPYRKKSETCEYY